MPKLKTKDSIKILQITDTHLFGNKNKDLLGVKTNQVFQAICKQIMHVHKDLDLVLATGDISHDGSTDSYKFFFDNASKLAPMLRSLPGNHDLTKELLENWPEFSQAINNIGNWQIISLDSTIAKSNNGNLNADQIKLLKNTCNSAYDKNVLIALHHNPIPMGSQWLDTMMLNNSAEFLDIIADYKNIKAVIWGHVHQEYDQIHDFNDNYPVRFLSCPATSIQFLPLSQKFSLDTKDPGYRIIELKNNGEIDTQVVRVAGTGIQPRLKSVGY